MKKIGIIALLAGLLGLASESMGQICGSNTPTFTADLSSNKDSVWTSTSVKRQDTCCGASSPDVCVKFKVTLAPDAYGIKLDIVSGALPPGALYYQIGCGKKVPVGERICLSSSGPHTVTFCKPGNNSNQYQISSITPPNASNDIILSEACQGTIAAYGFEDTSITWQSVNNNAFHNSFLSCTEDCDTTYVQAKSGYPNYVDYVVCGNPEGSCGNLTECDTVRVEFVSDLNVDIQPDSPAVCYGSSTAEIKAMVSGGKPPYEYNWNTGATTKKINVGLGDYNVEVTDSTACPASADSVFVDSFSYPITANAGPDTTLCGSFRGISLEGSVKAASGGKWKGGNGSFQPSDSNLSTTYYPTSGEIQNDSLTLELITTGNKTCEPDTDRVKLYFADQPAPRIQGPKPVCFNQSAIYSAIGNPDNQYQWTVNGGTIKQSISNDSVRIAWDQNTGMSGITLKASNASDCDTTINLQVRVNSLPDSFILGPDSVCTQRRKTYNTVDSSNYQYSWQLNNGIIQQGQGSHEIITEWQTSGNDQLKVKVETQAGCIGKSTKPIAINPSPKPIISGPKDICAYSLQEYNIEKPHVQNYQWQAQGGTVVSGNGTSQVTIEWGASGKGAINLTATNRYGCDSSIQFETTINQAPQFSINGPDNVCAFSENVQYEAIDPNDSNNVYNWQVTGGNIVGSTNGTKVNIDWEGAGKGILTAEVYNPNTGCSEQKSIEVNIQPQPTPLIEGPDIVCANDRKIYYSVNSSPDQNYFWQINGGKILGGSGTQQVQVKWSNQDTGRIEVHVVNQQSRCDSVVSETVQIFEASAISPRDTAGCEDLKLQFTGKSNQPNSQYFWDFDNGVSSNKKEPEVTFKEPGFYKVRLRTETSRGCTDTVSTNVTVHEKPFSDFEVLYQRPESFIMAEEDSLVVNNLSKGGKFYEWDFGDGEQSLEKEPVHAYTAYGHYPVSLIVENEHQCTDSSQKVVLVKVPSNIYVPNVFSPNDNDINDEFGISTYNIDKFEIFIFDRWGEIIFRSNNEDFTWDGQYKGAKVQDEVYHYVILAEDENGKQIKKTGRVTVIK